MRVAKAAAVTICLSTPARAAPEAERGVQIPGAASLSCPIAEAAGASVKVATLESTLLSASGATVQSGMRAVAVSDRPSESVKPIFERPIRNLPDRKLIAVVVTYPPAARSRPHHHANSAFIYAYVLSGAIRSAVDAEPTRIYRAGESFYEEPGAHHLVSENASDTEPASLLAVFVVKNEDKPLTAPDAENGK